MTPNKFDFLSILKRRKVDVGRWLTDEKIMTLDEYVKWTQVNADKYFFTEELATEVLNVLGTERSDGLVELNLSIPEPVRPVGDDQEKRNKKRKNAFQAIYTSSVSGSNSDPDDVE